jgi:hypothetical protein
MEQLSEHRRARIEAIIKSDDGVCLYDLHDVVLSADYLRASVQKIDECLTALLRFVESRYPYVEDSTA